jgi:hypothetical protein
MHATQTTIKPLKESRLQTILGDGRFSPNMYRIQAKNRSLKNRARAAETRTLGMQVAANSATTSPAGRDWLRFPCGFRRASTPK